MTLWAIVPVKPLRRGKSRLSSVLTEDQRAALNKKLLIHTLDTITQLTELEQVLVVSRDPEALAIARFHGARTVLEDGTPHLNIALTRATAVAMMYSAAGVLVLPADLPQMTADDIRVMVESAGPSNCVVIAPDHRQEGTNALLIKPPGAITYNFGENSYLRHLNQAQIKGLKTKIIDLPSLARDVDLPEDLAFLNGQLEDWTHVDEKAHHKSGHVGYYTELITNGTAGSDN
jgi:2-phospho-L-lactate guanylyltransferase